MRFREFFEMALKNFKTGPFVDDNQLEPNQFRTINQRDEKAVTHTKTYRQLEAVLKRSTHFDFNIIVGQPPPTQYSGRKGTREFVQEMVKRGEIELANHITFIKTASSGDTLTAWMILHNIGHAVLDGDIPIGGEAMIKISRLLSSIEKGINIGDMSRVKALAPNFQFRSARSSTKDINSKNRITDVGELVFELMAEYLWHGHIRLNNPENGWVVKQIEEQLHVALAACVGQIIIDDA